MAITDDMEGIYKTTPSSKTDSKSKNIYHNWYEQKPYAIRFIGRKKKPEVFYLPISPSNLNITTHFATNVISTMYGTVEEHSEQRYYDIQISGTTGMSPRYYKPIGLENPISSGRGGFHIRKAIGGTNLGGFFQRTQDAINSTLDQVSDLIGDDEPINGVNLESSGYVAFHNLYKFILAYKKDTSGENSTVKRTRHPLEFINYKDNNEYDVAITGFQLTRDASNPMLYNYNLTMRAYNLRSADTSISRGADVQDRASALGLVGLDSSFFTKMATKAKKAKGAAYGALGALKGFGK